MGRFSATVMGSVVFAAAAIMLPGCMGGCGDFSVVRGTQVVHAPAKTGGAAPLKVQTRNGSVTINKGGSEPVVEAEIRARTKERLEATKVLAEVEPDGTLFVRVAWPEGKAENNEGCSLTITLPEASGLDVQTSNGSIRVGGFGGAAVLKTSNGQVCVTGHNGPVNVDTSNARVECSDIRGDAVCESSNGTVALTNIDGKACADTCNGRIVVKLSPNSAGPIKANTSNGGISLTVGSGFKGAMKLDTSNGSVRLSGVDAPGIITEKLSRTGAHVRFPAAGDESVADTSNASVDLTVAR